MNDNPWLIDGVITRTKEMAKELGFRLEPGSYNILVPVGREALEHHPVLGHAHIEIRADNPPYGKNMMLARLDDWPTANLYLQGYRQGKLEMIALAKGKKEKNGG